MWLDEEDISTEILTKHGVEQFPGIRAIKSEKKSGVDAIAKTPLPLLCRPMNQGIKIPSNKNNVHEDQLPTATTEVEW